MSYTKPKLQERYNTDSIFNAVVNSMISMIEQYGVTPSEMREAMFLAHYIYEMKNPQAIQELMNINIMDVYKNGPR